MDSEAKGKECGGGGGGCVCVVCVCVCGLIIKRLTSKIAFCTNLESIYIHM